MRPHCDWEREHNSPLIPFAQVVTISRSAGVNMPLFLVIATPLSSLRQGESVMCSFKRPLASVGCGRRRHFRSRSDCYSESIVVVDRISN